MANETSVRSGGVLQFIQRNYVLVAAVLIVLFLFIPLPKVFVDLSMILNLTFAFVIFLVVLSTPRASDFNTFPQIILFQTLFGLAINVSSTVLILRNPATTGYSNAQSAMVQAFANIVAGNDVVIGFVIFIILIVVQMVVITKGAERTSEVAARFTLDSMQSKTFDIDNRLAQGYIDADEARRQKDALSKEIDFYSAMDGASKFVSGNVKAGIFITVINLVGGFVIGMVRGRLDFSSALNTYARLTIGDGLMSQLPSLVISFATGILITGSKSDDDLGARIKADFTRSGYIYMIVGAVLVITGIALRNGTQWLLLPVGVFFIFVGVRLSRSKAAEAKALSEKEAQEKSLKQKSAASPDSEKIAMLDDMSLELGFALVPLVSKDKGAELLERITSMRNHAKLDMGFVIPKIRIQDNITLEPNDYSFKIRGIEVGHGNIRLGFYLCIDNGTVTSPIKGEKTKDPTFGMDAIWVPESRKNEAESAGYMVVDAPTIVATHIQELIHSHAAELLNRQAVASIMDTVKEKEPVLVDEVLNTAHISYGLIEQVLKNLLSEKVSIRNISVILETLADFAGVTHSVWDLTEKVRANLGLQICMQNCDEADSTLRVIVLSPGYADLMQANAQIPSDGSRPFVALSLEDGRAWISDASSAIATVRNKGIPPVILCASNVRLLVKTSLEREMPGITVLSQAEVLNAGTSIKVEPIGVIAREGE